MRRVGEIRVTNRDGSYGTDGSGELEAAALARGRRLIAEAERIFGLNRRDKFACWRSRHGIMIKNITLTPPLSPADEVLDAREELLRARAALLAGGPR